MTQSKTSILDLNNVNHLFEDSAKVDEFVVNIKEILSGLMGHPSNSVKIRGTQSDVQALVEILRTEKNFLEANQKYGADHPKFEEAKIQNEQQIKEFENSIGIEWPLR